MSTCMGHVQRVLFEGKRAVGVQYEFAGTPIKVKNRKDVFSHCVSQFDFLFASFSICSIGLLLRSSAKSLDKTESV